MSIIGFKHSPAFGPENHRSMSFFGKVEVAVDQWHPPSPTGPRGPSHTAGGDEIQSFNTISPDVDHLLKLGFRNTIGHWDTGNVVSGGDDKTIGFGGTPWGTENRSNSWNREDSPWTVDRTEIVAEACRAVVGFCSLHEINAEPRDLKKWSGKVYESILYIFIGSWMQLKAWDSTFKIVKNVEFVFLFPRCSKFRNRSMLFRQTSIPRVEEVCCFPSSGRLVRYGCRSWLWKFGECAVHCQGGKMGKIWRSRFILVSQKYTLDDSEIFLNHPKSVVHVFDVDLDSFG